MIGLSPHRQRKSYSLQIFIVLLAIFLSFSYFRNFLGFRSLIINTIYPFQFAAVSVWHGATAAPGSLFSLASLRQENVSLKKDLAKLQAKTLTLLEKERENKRLAALLKLKQNSDYAKSLLPARVIGRSPSAWQAIIQIDQGSNHGVAVDQSIITSQGLVGRVIETTALTSKVMLLTDDRSVVAAVDGRSRSLGMVRGGHPFKLFMQYVDVASDVKVGDLIYTSQISTFVPPGFLIGTVTKAQKKEHDLFYQIEVKPAVEFGSLEEVFILK